MAKKHDRPTTNSTAQRMRAASSPTIGVLVKLGSIAVHADEYLSVHGLPLDKVALDQLLADREIIEWLAEMTKIGMLPVKRN